MDRLLIDNSHRERIPYALQPLIIARPLGTVNLFLPLCNLKVAPPGPAVWVTTPDVLYLRPIYTSL